MNKKKKLYILISIYDKSNVPIEAESIMINDLATKAMSKELLGLLFSYKSVTLLCPALEMVPVPFKLAGLCRLLTWGKVIWTDNKTSRCIFWHSLFGYFGEYFIDLCFKRRYIEGILGEIDTLNIENRFDDSNKVIYNPDSYHIAYIRTDEPCHLNAGGSVGHIAGVMNNLEDVTGCSPIFISTESIPTVNEGIEFYQIDNRILHRNISFFNQISFNKTCYESICEALCNKNVNIIYHRYSLGSYAVVKYSLKHHIPYILEYNGSELWVLRNWVKDSKSARTPYADVLQTIEELVLHNAALIVCVSKALKEQLIEMGIPSIKILVNSNGVDTERYTPNIDGSHIRRRYSICDDQLIIGFIGTFGAWHGAERLAAVFAELSSCYNNIHLMLIGDGMKMGEVRKNLSFIDESRYTLTGMIPQEEGPQHLAACDILVSPTIPNPDGTPFFGSPTKTYEYMAMGRAIVVSNMDQMAETFEHEKTALLFEPGDDNDLRRQLERLIEDRNLRNQLGINARKEAVINHTWYKHTERIISAFKRLH